MSHRQHHKSIREPADNSYLDRNERRKMAIDWLHTVKGQSDCLHCGIHDPAIYEFHHREPKEKISTVSHLVHRGAPLRMIFQEAAKCDILCPTCHKLEHVRMAELNRE